MKSQSRNIGLIFSALLVCALAGCSSHRPVKPPAETEAIRKLESRDDFKIEAAVYGYLLEKHPWGNGEYSAIFVEGGDDWVAALNGKFPKHRPPLKPSHRAQQRPHQTPVDQDTGKPALILSAKAMDPTEDVSEAIGTWYAGDAASGMCAFVLVKADDQWTIQGAK